MIFEYLFGRLVQMLKVAKDSICRILKGKNGLSTAILAHPPGLSTLGAVFSIGGQDGSVSGETFVTLKAKIFDAIQSPENAYRHGISTCVSIQKEFSVVTFQFLPEVSSKARTIFERMFDGRMPSSISAGMARHNMTQQEPLGLLTPKLKLESMACAASFDNPKHKIDVYTDSVSSVKVSDSILKSFKSKCLLIGSEDQAELLTQLGNSFPENNTKIDSVASKFTPGIISRKSSGFATAGDMLLKNPNNADVSLSWNAVPITSDKFFTYKVLEKLFGGGSSFSSEGLGVGTASSLLSKYVLYRLHSCEQIRAHFNPYSANGLFSVVFNVPGDDLKKAARMISNAINRADSISDETFRAAKEQAALEYLKMIDVGYVRFEEFGTQTLFFGEGKSSAGIVEAMRSVTKDDCMKVIEETMKSKPSVALIGKGNPIDVLENWK